MSLNVKEIGFHNLMLFIEHVNELIENFEKHKEENKDNPFIQQYADGGLSVLKVYKELFYDLNEAKIRAEHPFAKEFFKLKKILKERNEKKEKEL